MPKSKQPKIELNEKFREALSAMGAPGRNVFITGRAGTGKSTLLEYFREHTRKKIVVLAPTGVAALNVRGATIHSFFGFKPDIAPAKVRKLKPGDERAVLVKKLDAVVIDEISMVRADLLDCVDKFLRLNGRERGLPFGGVKMIFLGDLYQLPPVVTSRDKGIFSGYYESPYFFSAQAFMRGFEMKLIELEKVYRQSDPEFVALLNTVRNNTAGTAELNAFNTRFRPAFEPSGKDLHIYLTATNDQARRINLDRLARLPGRTALSPAAIRGEFDAKSLPTEAELRFKPDAQVMMLNNDSQGRWVNGSLGRILTIEEDDDLGTFIKVRLEDGKTAEVMPYTWEMFDYRLVDGEIDTEKVGSFTQFPFKLAWAITIHKSQGKTFDRVVIDVGRGTFAHGQMYVALSRCRTLAGIVLKRELQKGHIRMDWRVVKFVTDYQYALSERDLPLAEKVKLINKAIKEGRALRIVYLKNRDIKSRRTIEPHSVGTCKYNKKEFPGLKAYCRERGQDRVFRVDRILEMEMGE